MANWQKGFGVALMGMGDQISVNYNNSKDEARKIAAEDRQYQTSMRKEQELHNLGIQRETKARNDQADAMEASGQYSPEEIAGVRSGSGLSMAAQREGKVADATAMAEAKGTVETEAQMNELRKLYPGKSDEEIYAIKKQKMDEASMTAAERNDVKVQEIIGDKDIKDLSANDKLRLAGYGVKIPGAKVVELTPAVMESARKSTREEAKTMYNEDTMSDADVVNEFRRQLQANGKPVPDKIPPKQARQALIDNQATGGYIRAIHTLTGQFATSTPDGATITEEQSVAAIEEVKPKPQGASDQFGKISSLRMEGDEKPAPAPFVRQQDRVPSQGALQAPALGGMPKSKPAGVPTLPKPQNQGALQGVDPRVNDIISRMSQ